MDISGLSDVYLTYYTVPDILVSPAKTVPRSKTKTQTLTPVWSDSEVPELFLNIERYADLTYAHLAIVLMDYDALDADDRMGQCLLSLAALPAGGEIKTFTLPVVKAGVQHGTLTFSAQLIFPSTAARNAARAPAATAACGAAGKCCVIQ